jgi:hypothetical protein
MEKNMQTSSIYHLENGRHYILVEEQAVGREMANLQLAIRMSSAKITEIQAQMAMLDDGSDEYNDLQDEMNDHQILISDFNNRLDDLAKLPALPT